MPSKRLESCGEIHEKMIRFNFICQRDEKTHSEQHLFLAIGTQLQLSKCFQPKSKRWTFLSLILLYEYSARGLDKMLNKSSRSCFTHSFPLKPFKILIHFKSLYYILCFLFITAYIICPLNSTFGE